MISGIPSRHPVQVLLILLASGALEFSVAADMRVQKPEFLITLPDGWFEVPREDLDKISEKINRAKPLGTAAEDLTQIGYAFQVINDGWLTMPNITIEHRTTGRIHESQIESVSMLDVKYIEHEMAKTAPYYIKEFHFITPEYDRKNGIVWMKIDMTTDKEDATALMAMFPTELGVLFVTGTAATADFSKYEETFRACLRSVKVDSSIAYRFSLFRRIMQPDTTAGAFGVLVTWIVILIAGVTLVVKVTRNWLSG